MLQICFFGYLSLAISNTQNVNCMWAGTLFLFTDVSPALRRPSGPEKALDKQIFQKKWHLSWTNKRGFNRWETGGGIGLEEYNWSNEVAQRRRSELMEFNDFK